MTCITSKRVFEMGEIYIEENHNYQFDFREADWSMELQPRYRRANLELADVDYILEYQKRLILLEYKNAKIAWEQGHFNDALKFNPHSDSMISKVAHKFFDSWFYLSAHRCKRPVTYIYILEWPKGDGVTRRNLRNRIERILPFRFQKMEAPIKGIIDEFSVLSIKEWNQRFCGLPITYIGEGGE